MELRLNRILQNSRKTLGNLDLIDSGEHLLRLRTIELPWNNNMSKISCIPEGTYEAIVGHNSPKFGWTIWLQNVPGRSEILIHSANFVRQLLGCISPGLFHRDIDKDGIIDVTSSKFAMSVLQNYLEGFKRINIHIEDYPQINFVEVNTTAPDSLKYIFK